MNHIDTIFVDGIRSSRVQRPGQPRNWGWWQRMYEIKEDGCISAGKGWRCTCQPDDIGSAYTHRYDGTEICFDHYMAHGHIHSIGKCQTNAPKYGERWWDSSDYFWSQFRAEDGEADTAE